MEKEKERYRDVFGTKLKKNAHKIMLSIFSGIVRSILMLLPTMMIQSIINGVYDNVGIVELSIKGILYIAFPAMVLVLYVIDTWISRFIFNIVKEIRLEIVKNIINQPVTWIKAVSHHELYNKAIQTTIKIADFYFSTLSNLIWYSTTIIVGFILMAEIDITIAIILVMISLVQMLLVGVYKKVSKRANEVMNEVTVEGNKIISDVIEYCTYIKLLGLSNKVSDRENSWINNYRKANHLQIYINALADVTVIVCELLRIIILLLFSRNACLNENMLIGDVYAMNAYITWMTPVFFGLQRWYIEFFVSRNNRERIEGVLILPEPENNEEIICRGIMQLNFSGISFGYGRDDSIILNDVSMECKRGEIFFVVGDSGCGKSTLVKLLLRFEKCYKGEISINGISIDKYEEKSYRQQVCVAMQETQFIETSLRENLLISGVVCGDDEILHLLNNLGLMELVNRLSDGLNTIVVSEKIGFSDGEKKRLGVARVLLSNASIMVFDEPTASLDNVIKDLVMKAIRNVSNDKIIIIIITHDHDIILEQDKICELETKSEKYSEF